MTARALRGFADGFVSVLLASYLDGLGFSAVQIGAIITTTLLGSAALTLGVGLVSNRIHPLRVLFGAAALMFATGLGFAAVTDFWPLLVVAFAGTLNPSAGDVSVFLPVEQALLSEKVSGNDRTALFARYNLGGAFAGALGALASGIPAVLARTNDWDRTDAERWGFVLYAAVALVIAVVYLGVQPAVRRGAGEARRSVLARSRRVVLHLAALFSLDSFGGGFVVQSLLVLWLFKRFDTSTATVATVFFAAGLLTALSQLASSWLAGRIGLIRTMVFTHLPANGFLIVAALMPTAPLAIFFLLLRMALSQMDVPARQSFVMAVVPPEERAAAASVTNVPRSLASALSPLLAGAMLSMSSFGWPLIAGGVLKIVYDLLLLLQFRAVQLPEDGAP
ncbi:MAG: MFS transporter [Chloroflexi bacterium]|nr:MFS transporter [Chloroflexota bacterium]